MHEPSIPSPCHTVSSQPYLELTWIQFDTTSQSQVWADCPLASYLESGKYIDHNKQNQTWCFKLSNFHTKHFYLHKSISRVWFFGLNCSRLGNLDCGCFGIITNSYPRNLLLLRHLIRVIRKHDLTNKKTMTITKTKGKTFELQLGPRSDCGSVGIIPNHNPRDLLYLRHLIRVMRRHDLTNKNTMTITKTK